MPVQTSYSERQPVGFEGQRASESNWNAHTRICETSAGIDFGRAVSQGTSDKEAVIGGALAAFVGVTMRDPTLPVGNADKYARYDQMSVLTEGEIWVKPSVQVVAGDPVHFNATTGVFTNTGGSGPIPGASYLSSAAANGLAKIHLPNYIP